MSTTVGSIDVKLMASTVAFRKAMAAASASMSLITGAAVGASAAIVGIGLASLKVATEFETSMTRVAAVSNAT